MCFILTLLLVLLLVASDFRPLNLVKRKHAHTLAMRDLIPHPQGGWLTDSQHLVPHLASQLRFSINQD